MSDRTWAVQIKAKDGRWFIASWGWDDDTDTCGLAVFYVFGSARKVARRFAQDGLTTRVKRVQVEVGA